MIHNLLTQVGNESDQLPFGKHTLWFTPSRLNPSLQKWSAVEPTVSDVTVVLPFAGVPGFPHKIAAKIMYAYLLNYYSNHTHALWSSKTPKWTIGC